MLNSAPTILLVDDEPTVLTLVATVLGREGYQVLRTADPIAAISLARDGDTPDLLLTDVTMPGMNGPMLARHVQEEFPGTKVLFMTANSCTTDVDHGIPQHADVLRKPFRIGELVERVRLALGTCSAAAAC